MMMMMHMTFYWSNKVTILVDSWRTDSWISYALTLLACLLASSFYQYLENRRIRFKLLSSQKQTQIHIPFLRPNLAAADKPKLEFKLVGAVLYGVNSAIGYLLMLAVMSFNGGVFAAVVVGLTVGYFIFRSDGHEDHAPTVVDNSCACA